MLLQFLESLGVEFEMDWDDEVSIAVPSGISYAEIEQALQPFGKNLSEQVRFRSKRQRSVFVGGQLNGQEVDGRVRGVKSGWGHTMADGKYGHWIRHHLKRGRWEVYEQGMTDGRAFFRGYASSEQKARRGEITEQPGAVRSDDRS